MNKKMSELFNQIIGHFILQEQRKEITEDEFYRRMDQFNNFENDLKYHNKFEEVDIEC